MSHAAFGSRARQGDEPARKIFRTLGKALGIGLANVLNIFNLPMYVIGGGVASAWDAFAPSMLDELRARSFVYTATGSPEDGAADKTIRNQSVPRQGTVITRASLGSDAGLLGAARLPMMAATNPVLEAKSQKA